MREQYFYVGSYTEPILMGDGVLHQGQGEGISLCALDMGTGKARLVSTFRDVRNPSYLAVNNAATCLYACNELKEFQCEVGGGVSAFRIGKDLSLSFLNALPTLGADPCHVVLNGTNVFACNYGGGSLAVFALGENGALLERTQFFQYEGGGKDPARQEGPHAHSLLFAPGNEFAFMADLGRDLLVGYQVQEGKTPLKSHMDFRLEGGSGPRCAVSDGGGRHLYVINELRNTVLVLRTDAKTGSLLQLQELPLLPYELRGGSDSAADIRLTPDGAWLYCSIRGSDRLSFFHVEKDGMLSYSGNIATGGRVPRCFEIEKTGKYLLCANQDSDNITVFSIEQETGTLHPVSSLSVGTPTCVVCIPC